VVAGPPRDAWIALGPGSVFVVAGVAVMAYGARQFTPPAAALTLERGRGRRRRDVTPPRRGRARG
jgi:hypothetical protein